MGLEVNMCIKQDTVFTRFKGELDEMSVTDIRAKLCEILRKYDVKNIVFNMRDLSFMDSTGIGMIIGRYNQVKEKSGKTADRKKNRCLLWLSASSSKLSTGI